VTSNDLGLGGRDQQKLLRKPELQLQPNIFVKKIKCIQKDLEQTTMTFKLCYISQPIKNTTHFKLFEISYQWSMVRWHSSITESVWPFSSYSWLKKLNFKLYINQEITLDKSQRLNWKDILKFLLLLHLDGLFAPLICLLFFAPRQGYFMI